MVQDNSEGEVSDEDKKKMADGLADLFVDLTKALEEGKPFIVHANIESIENFASEAHGYGYKTHRNLVHTFFASLATRFHGKIM